MQISRWFWRWLKNRHRQQRSASPWSPQAHLHVRRLEDRRVLSVTVTVNMAGDVTVNIAGNDTAQISYDGTNLIVADGTDTVVFNAALSPTADLTVNGVNDGLTQNVEFEGSVPIPLDSLTVNNTVENAFFSVPLVIDNGAVTVRVADDVTLAASGQITNTVGSITVEAGAAADDTVTMASGSALQAATSVSVSAGGDITLQQIQSGSGGVTVTGLNVSLESSVTTTGAVNITAQDQLLLTADGDVNAGAATITLRANQNGVGGEDFVQHSGSVIQTTNNTSTAVTITVGGSGDAFVGQIQAGTAGGTVNITAGGAISDHLLGETPNVVASNLLLTAGTGIGVGDDLDLQVSNLEGGTSTGGIFLQNTGNLSIGLLTGSLGGLDVTGASGEIVVATSGSLVVNEGISGPGHITLQATGPTANLTISIGSGVISAGGNIKLSADQTATLSEDVITAGSGSITVTGNADTGARNIVVNFGAVVRVVNGNLTLDADQGVSLAGVFNGVAISGAVLETTGTGNILITGRAGNSGGVGVFISGSTIRSTAASLGANEGTITITGVGGNGVNECDGVRIDGGGTVVTSQAGDITITGTGGPLATGEFNDGVQISSGAVVSSTGTADILIVGVSGDGVATNGNAGIRVSGVGAAISSTQGNITLQGTSIDSTGSANHGVVLEHGGSLTITGSGELLMVGTAATNNPGVGFGIKLGEGNVNITLAGATNTFLADSMDIAATVNLNAGTNTVVIAPLTAGVGISLGTTDVVGQLSLSDFELDRITCSRLILGSHTAGAITFGQNIDFTDTPLVPTVHFITGAGITATAAGIRVHDLAITANGNVVFTNAFSNVNRLAVLIGPAGGNVTFVDASGILVSTVDGIVGITTVGNVTLTATTGAIVIGDGAGQDILADSGNVQLNSTAGVSQAAGSTITAAGLALTGSGAFTLTEQNDVGSLAANIQGSLTYYDRNDFAVGTVNTTVGLTTTGVGGNVSLTAGGIGADPPAQIILSANVNTTGTQTYHSTVVLGADVVLSSSGAGAAGNITFAHDVNDDGNPLTSSRLTVNTAGTTLFSAGVGNVAPLTSLTTDAAGATHVASGAVTTTGSQAYGDLVLTTHTTLTSTGGGNITLQVAVSGAFDLVINTTGVTTLPLANLNSITTDAGGTTILNGNITTTAFQSYHDNVILTSNVTLTSTGGGNISIGGTINDDGNAATSSHLVINTAGVTTLGGAVGNTAPLSSLTTDAPGSLVLTQGQVTTTGAQTYHDLSTLVADSTFTSTGGGDIFFLNNLAGAFALTVNTAGLTTFSGTLHVASVNTNPGGTTRLGGNVITTGAQVFGDHVLLLNDVVLQSTGNAPITLGGTVDGGGKSLTITTAATTTLGNNLTNLGSLTTDGGGITELCASITTMNAQTYLDAVILCADAVLTSTLGGNITFAQTVDDDGLAATSSHLVVNTSGTTSFQGAVGTAALSSLTTDAGGSTVLAGGLVRTVGAQTYGEAVVVASEVVLISTGGGSIVLAQSVNADDASSSDRTLTVMTVGGSVTFAGAVGDQVNGALADLDVTAATIHLNGGTIRVDDQGGQTVTLTGAVILGSNVLIDTHGAADNHVLLAGTINADNASLHDRTLTIDAGSATVTFQGAVGTGTHGALADLDVTASTIHLQGSTLRVDDGGGQTVTLAGDVVLGTSVNIDVDGAADNHLQFGGSVNGAHGLTVTAGTGDVLFTAAVGNVTALAGLTINSADDVQFQGTVQVGGNLSVDSRTLVALHAVTVGGSVSWTTVDGTTLMASADVHADAGISIHGGLITAADLTTANGATVLDGPVTLTGDVLVDSDRHETGGAAITFLGTVQLGSFSLTVDAGTAGDILVQQAVTGTGNLTVQQGDEQTYAGLHVGHLSILDATTRVTLTGAVVAAGNVLICSQGTVDVQQSLIAGGNIVFCAPDGVQLCGDITAAGDITFQHAVILCDTISISSTGGGQIVFQATVDSAAHQAYGLTVNTTGLTDFQAAVGAAPHQALGHLITDAGGLTQLAANVTTIGEQEYGDALTLTGSVVLRSGDTDASGEGVECLGIVTGSGFDLTVVGGVFFAQAVTGLGVFLADRLDTEATLAAVSVHITSTSELGGNVTTLAGQQYDGAVVLTADVVAQSLGAADITFGSTVDGTFALQVNTTGVTTFAGTVGGLSPLLNLTTDAGGSTLLSTTSIQAGVVHFQDDVELAVSTTVTGTTSVTFGRSVSGQTGSEDLLVNSLGAVTFDGAVSPLHNVQVQAAGQTTFNAPVNITGTLLTDAAGMTRLNTPTLTAGEVVFLDAVEIAQDLVVTAGNMTWGGTVDEAASNTGSLLTLTITHPATGDITFQAAVGATRALDGLIITAANDVTFAATLETSGDVRQLSGTGTTTFHGTSGSGLGGQLLVNTDAVVFLATDVVTAGAVVIKAQNGITFGAGAGLNAGASTITLYANQDGVGSESFSQASGSVIQTTNESDDALRIVVGGAGHAAVSDLRAGTTTGVVSITVGGAITDNSAGETANITAASAALQAETGIGATDDLNTAVAQLAFSNTVSGLVQISDVDHLTLTTVDGLVTSLAVAGGTVTAGHSLTIAMTIQVGGDFAFVAANAAHVAGNNLFIAADVTHLTGDGSLVFQAGDDILHTAGVITNTLGTVQEVCFLADQEGAAGTDADRGGITQTGGSLLAGQVLFLSHESVNYAQATNDVDVVAAHLTGLGSSFTFHDADELTVGTVKGTAGITTHTGNVTLVTGSALTIGTGAGEDIVAGGATVVLDAAMHGVLEQHGSTIQAQALLLRGTGTFELLQPNDVDIVAADVSGSVAVRDTDDLMVGTVGITGGIQTNGHDVTLHTGGLLTIGSGAGEDLSAAGATVTLQSAAGVLEQAGSQVQAQALLLLGAGDFTLQQQNDVDVLAAAVDGTLQYQDQDDLTVGTVGATSGITTVNDAVALTTGGHLHLAQAVTVGTADLTLNVTGALTQAATGSVQAQGLQLLGNGSVQLTTAANDVDLLAAHFDGALAYSDVDDLTIGTVGTTSGITTVNDAVALTTGGHLHLAQAVTVGTADLTLNVTGALTQAAVGTVQAQGLQLLGNGAVQLTTAANDVDLLAAHFDGALAYSDVDDLTIGTVGTTSGITTVNDAVALTTGGHLTIGSGGGEDVQVGLATVTLDSSAGVSEQAGSTIHAQALLLRGTGDFQLGEANDVAVLAAEITGSLTYADVNDLSVGTVAGVDGIRTGQPADGGDVTLLAAGSLSVDADINTQGGSGGVVTVSGGTLNAQLIAGAGDITLQSGDENLLINVDQMFATTVVLQARCDVIVNAMLTTTTAGADVLLRGDSDLNGTGGVWVTVAGQIVSAGAIELTGSDLCATVGAIDSVRIDHEGAVPQLQAAGNIVLASGTAAPAEADVVVEGVVRSLTGQIIFVAADSVLVRSQIEALAGSVSFLADTVLTGDLHVQAAGNVLFAGTVHDDGLAGTSSNLTVTSAGVTTFAAAVGEGAPLSSLTTQGGGITQLTGSVSTTEAQTYFDAVVLRADVVLTSTAGGSVVFHSTVDSEAGLPRSLTVQTTGVTEFQGAVGQTHALANLTTDAGGVTHLAGGLIRTTGAQTFGDDVVLLTNTLLLTTAGAATGADIVLAGLVQTNGFDLTLQGGTLGDILLQGAVTGGGVLTVTSGDVVACAAVTVDELLVLAATTSVTLHGHVVVTQDVTLNSAGVIVQEQSVTAGQQVSYVAGLSITVGGALTAGTDIIVAAGTAVAITGSVTAVTGSLAMVAGTTLEVHGPLQAGVDVTLTAGGDLAVQGTVVAGNDMHATSLTGQLLLNQAVTAGGHIALKAAGDIHVGSAVTALAGSLTIEAGDDLTVTGALQAAGDVQAQAAGEATVNGTVQAGNDVLLTATTGDLTIGGSITAGVHVSLQSGLNLTVGGTVIATGGDAVAGVGASLFVDGAVEAGEDVVLHAQTTIQVQGTVTGGEQVQITATSGDLLIGGAVEASDQVMLQSGASTVVTGAITADAGSLTVHAGTSLTAGGPLTAGLDVLVNTGTQAALNGMVVAGRNIQVQAGTTLTAEGPLTAGDGVTLSAPAGITLSASADILAGAGGIVITGPLVTAADFLTENGTLLLQGPVTLTGNVRWDTDLTETGGANLVVTGPVQLSTFSLTIDAGVLGDLQLQAAVAGTGDFLVEQGDQQTYAALNVGNLTILDATTSVTFTGTVTATQDISICSRGTVEIQQSLTAGGTIEFCAPGGLRLCGNITGGGDITFQHGVTLCHSVVVTSTAGGAVTFMAAVNSTAHQAHGLTVITSGTTTFLGAVGEGPDQALGHLVTDAGGTTLLAGGLVRTTGLQSYGDHLVLLDHTLLVSTAGSAAGADIFTFGTVQTNGFDFTLDAGTGGDIGLLGPVTGGGVVTIVQGDQVTLAALTVDELQVQAATHSVTLQGAVVVTGSVTIQTAGSVTQMQAVTAGGTVTYQAGESILALGSLTAQTLVLTAGSGSISVHGELTAPLDIQLAAGDDVSITGSTTVLSGNLTVLAGGDVQVFGPAQAQNILLTALSGDLSLTSALTADQQIQLTAGDDVFANGSITVLSGDFSVVAGGDVTLGGTTSAANLQITTLAGDVLLGGELTAREDVTVLAGGNVQVRNTVTAESGSVLLDAGGGSLLMLEGTTVTAAEAVLLSAQQDILLSRVVTPGTVTLSTEAGAVLDAGDELGADIVAPLLVLNTAGGVGVGNPLETSVQQIVGVNAISGDVALVNDVGGTLTLGATGGSAGLTNRGGGIWIVNNGAIHVEGPIAATNGGTVSLEAVANGGDDDHLIVNAPISATGGQGSVFLFAGTDLVINDAGSTPEVLVENAGTIVGSAGRQVVLGENVVLQSGTGQVTTLPPYLASVSASQITANGQTVLTLTFSQPLAQGYVIEISSPDGLPLRHVVTAEEAGQTTLQIAYSAAPNPQNSAAEVTIQIVIHLPDSIRLFEAGVEITEEAETTASNPGLGVQVFVPFDTAPPVQPLSGPPPIVFDPALLGPSSPILERMSDVFLVVRQDESLLDERVVILEVLAPDGTILQRVTLAEETLDQLDRVVKQLPDGRYRFLLREPGETRLRLLQEVEIRQGRVWGGDDDTSDRPPGFRPKTSSAEPSPDVDEPPADALQPANGPQPTTTTLLRSGDELSPVNSPDEESIVGWRAWRARRAWETAGMQQIPSASSELADTDLVGWEAEAIDTENTVTTEDPLHTSSGESPLGTWGGRAVVAAAVAARFGRGARWRRQRPVG